MGSSICNVAVAACLGQTRFVDVSIDKYVDRESAYSDDTFVPCS